MIIDAHCHIYPDKIAEKASHATGAFYDLAMAFDGTVGTLMREGAKAGIDCFLVQSVATTPNQVRSINNYIAETVAAYPDKLFGLGTLHPESEDLAGDVAHLQQRGLHGVKLHPDIQHFKLDDYRCLKIYELCEAAGLPLLIHTGDNRYDYSNPNRLLPILDIYKSLTVVGAHFGGWSVWEEAAKQLYTVPNFYVDCSSSFYALRDETIRELIALYGGERVLFGSDYPMWHPDEELRRLQSLGLEKETLENILWRNAARVFRLPL